jgi:DNA-directed RNA polymerases I, II, and III subunit RPABC2
MAETTTLAGECGPRSGASLSNPYARYDAYDPEEPFEDDEPFEPPEDAAGEAERQADVTGEAADDLNIVAVNDPNAATGGKKKATEVTERKVPDEERTTTPYMTKYERARVLGTRALQIRYAFLLSDYVEKTGLIVF